MINPLTICIIRDAEQSENLTPVTIQVYSDLVFLKHHHFFFFEYLMFAHTKKRKKKKRKEIAIRSIQDLA